MVRWESGCVGCAVPAYPCEGTRCPNYSVPFYFCDKCGEEVDDLYKDDGQELCEHCLLEKHKIDFPD